MKTSIRSACIWLLIVFSSIATPVRAQWQQVGNPIHLPRQDFRTTIALDNVGTPYVATVLDTDGYELVVLKWDGTDWTQVGRTQMLYDEPLASLNVALAVSPAGMPYVALTTYSSKGDSLIVKKHDGTNWITLGSSGIFSNGANHQKELFLTIDAADTPYIALSDNPTGIRVLKYDGTAWISTGPVTTGGWIGGLGLDKKGALCLAYEDGTNGLRTFVKTYENGLWKLADTAGLDMIKHEFILMPLNSNGSGEYAALMSVYQNNPQTIMKHIGTSWVPLANGTFPHRTNIFGLLPDAAGTPYVFVVDTAKRSALLKHDGSKWVATDTAGFPVNPDGWYTTMVGDGENHFYIAPINSSQRDGLRIMKYTVPATATGAGGIVQQVGISIAPIPASQSILIRNRNTSLSGEEAIITDIQDRKVCQFTLSASQEIDIRNWSTGIYLLHLPDGSVMKMVKGD